ncbi:MAG: hypothetical protein KF768_01115 [Phycisphaeraceae bacterium]|nr:hypothetical protein [Phycisphaeraceae bacterium]
MPTSTGRRARYLAQSAAIMLAVSAICVFGVVLASREPIRIDTTASREHELSDRTRRVLATIDAPHEIVLVVNAAACDRRSLERAIDVLDMLDRASRNVSTTVVDAASGRGAVALDAVVQRLVERYAVTIRAANEAIASATGESQTLAELSDTAAESMQSAVDQLTPDSPNATELRRFFADSAAVLRLAGPDLRRAAQQAQQAASTPISGTNVPQHERATAILREPSLNLHRQLDEINAGLQALSQAQPGVIDEATRAAARSLFERTSVLRDRTAALLFTLDEVPTTPLERCVRAIQSGPTALIIGPPDTSPRSGSTLALSSTRGVTAVDVQSLLLPTSPDDPSRGRIDLRFRIEELVVGGLAVLNTRNAPIVCFVHGAPESDRLGPDFAPLRALAQRMSLRGIDLVEWPAAVKEHPPAVSTIPGGDARPVVYAVIPTNALTPEGAVRMKRLADRVTGLINEGRPVLLSLNPSTLPGIGQRDPMIETLEPLGLKPDTGRPIVQQITGTDRQPPPVLPDVVLSRSDPFTPIGQAIQSLRTHLRWAIPLRIDPVAQQRAGTSIKPILLVPAAQTTWAESEWLGLWQLSASDRLRISNPPTPHPVRDDVMGPWTVAAAIERGSNQGDSAPSSASTPTHGSGGRIVVVGSNGWFFDEFTQVADVIDGRPVARAPGNMELFESAVYWLAGQDDLIARSAEAEAAPVIRADLSDRSLSLLRWALIGGMPLAVLLLGVCWRLIRG